jgi:adenosylcobyric acid synthase
MTDTLLVAGTASHVGKSTVVAGLCRLLSREGVSVAPYKAQNMSNNARAVATSESIAGASRCPPEERDASFAWGEIGVSQYVQARAAGVVPTVDMNPVLLKPRGEGESQLVLQGEAVGDYAAGAYYDEHWERARRAASESFERLAAEYEVIVAEGAGSIAEINLQDRDLANVGTARFADASILLLGDIERGGVFASLYGTLELLPADLRERVCGTLITKFRGEKALLDPGIDQLEDRTGVPVLGVLPYEEVGLPAEDSLSLPAAGERATVGEEDGVSPAATVTIGVPRLPHLSNFTDLDPLARVPGVRVTYLPLGATLSDVDGVVLPGSKNTIDDLLALRDAGFDDEIDAFDGPIVGLCGGYQMLGERLYDAHLEGTGKRETIAGLGALSVETTFEPEKHVERVTHVLEGVGPLAAGEGPVSGYEIHTGHTDRLEPLPRPVGPESAASGTVVGTYLHGLFENPRAREAFLDSVYEAAGRKRPTASREARDPYRVAADLLAEHARLDELPIPLPGDIPHETN